MTQRGDAMSGTRTSDERERLARLGEAVLAGMTESAVSEQLLADRIVEQRPDLGRAEAEAAAHGCFERMAAREAENPLEHAEQLERYARATGRGW